MRVKTDKGTTECAFEEFASVEPRLNEVAEAYRKSKRDDKAKDFVQSSCAKLFGHASFNADYDAVACGRVGMEAIDAWDKWIEGKPLAYRKRYYSGDVVAACVIQHVSAPAQKAPAVPAVPKA